MNYDALLFLSFGGPDKPEDVMPFLQNVTRGRNIPQARLEEVAEHYYHFGGKSPINEQNLALIAALREELAERGLDLPIYFGNRNWHPMLEDTVRQMTADGVKTALAFVTSGFSCYSGCRQYREDILRAQEAVGNDAPQIDKIRVFYNHPGFIAPMVANVSKALAAWDEAEREKVHLVFTAHSIPMAQARNSAYEAQLAEACRLVAGAIGTKNYSLVYQSRSGAPHIPWLEPDILAYMEEIAAKGTQDIVIAPIGFISDHMEVLFDLDTEAVAKAEELGMRMQRAATVGTAKPFVGMIVDLMLERMSADYQYNFCTVDCCLPK